MSQQGYAQDAASESDSSAEPPTGGAETLCDRLSPVAPESFVGESDDDREAEARSAYRHSSELYQQGAFDDALDYTCQAYRLKPTSDLLFNLAQVLRQLGRCEEAAVAYRAYLSEPTTSQAGAIAEKHLLELEECSGGSAVSAAPPRAVRKESPTVEDVGPPLAEPETDEPPEEEGPEIPERSAKRSTSLLVVSASAGVLAATAVGLRVAAGVQHREYKQTGASNVRTLGRSLEAAAFVTGGGAIALGAVAIWMSVRKPSARQPQQKTSRVEAMVVPHTSGVFGSLRLRF